MKISILYGGDYRREFSQENARNIYNDFNSKKHNHEVKLYEIDKNGDIFYNQIKTDFYHCMLQSDHIFDCTSSHKNKKLLLDLVKKFSISLHFYNDINKEYFKKVLDQLDINHANYNIIKKDIHDPRIKIHDIWRKFHLPVKVSGANIYNFGLITYSPAEVLEHSLHILKKGEDVIVEEYNGHRIFVMYLIKNFRGESVYKTPVVQLVKDSRKINNKSYIRANFLSSDILSQMSIAASNISNHINSKIIQFEFELSGNNKKVKVLNISIKPDFTHKSVMKGVFEDYGISFSEIITQ